MLKPDSSWDLYAGGMQIGWNSSFFESDLKTFTVLSTADGLIRTDHKFCRDRGFKSPLRQARTYNPAICQGDKRYDQVIG